MYISFTQDVGAAALFLGSKLAGTLIRLQKIAEQCAKYSAQYDNDSISISTLESDWKDTILYHEELLLEHIVFDFEIDLPYRHLEKLFKKTLDIEKDLSKMAWFIANDTFHSDICIQYEPQDLAFACIYTACMQQDRSLPTSKDSESFWTATKASKTTIQGSIN
jgi:hypothetical protein